MDTQLTVKQIQQAIAEQYGIRKNVFIPNVSWGYFKTHEADLLMIQNHYLTEFEIKRSWEDFLADFKKHTNHFEGKVFRFYYVVPESIVDKCQEFLEKHEWPAPYNDKTVWNRTMPCGLLYYTENIGDGIGEKYRAIELSRYTDTYDKDYRLFLEEENALMRLGCMRLWGKASF